MATLIKSTLSFTGSSVLPSLSSLTYGYTQYASRVTADGGEIIDAAATQSAFTFLSSNGVSPAQFVVGASFGVKRSGGVLQKLYSFDGNDFIPAGAGDGPYHDTTGAFPVVRVDGVSEGKRLASIAQRPLLAANASGFCLAMAGRNDVAADSLLLALTAVADGTTNYAAAGLTGYNNDYSAGKFDFMTADSGYNPIGAINAGYQEIATVPSYADFMGVVGHLNAATNTASTYADGVASGTRVLTPAAYDYRGKPVRLSFASSYAGGYGTIRKQRFAELWVLNDCSAALAQALSARLGTLY